MTARPLTRALSRAPRALLALGLTAALVLTACGGGGSGGGGPPIVTPPASFDYAVLNDADALSGSADLYTVRLAISAAGFDQVDVDGLVTFPAQLPKQGITFEDGDAAIIAGGAGEGGRISLDDLLGGFAAVGLDPGLTHPTSDAVWTAKVAAMRLALVADLRAGTAAASDTQRYWAQLIVQLGRVAPVPYDLLDPTVSGDSLLEPVQVAFLSYRFAAELWAAGRRAAGLPVLSRLAATATPRPCTMTDTEATVMDGAALGVSTFMGKLIDEAAKTVSQAEKFSKFAGGANAVLSIVKVLWTFLAFEAHVTADTSLLVRTLNATAGDPAALKASFRFNTGNAQVLNCVRGALVSVGIDFSLPQDGPIANAGLDWEMFNVWERTQKTPIVRYQAGVSPLRRRTDANGEDTIDVEGAPKSPPLTGQVTADYRMVPFAAKVALKDTKIGQDIIDAIGAALAPNPALMALAVISETLYRAKTLVFAGHYNLPVEDHQSLANVSIIAQLSGGISGTIDAAGVGTESADASLYLVEKPAPTARRMNFLILNGTPHAGSFELRENALRTATYRGSYATTEPCTCVTGDWASAGAADVNGTATTDDGRVYLSVDLQPDGTYTMDIPFGAVRARGSRHFHASGCGDPPVDDDAKVDVSYPMGKVTITGTIDLTQPTGTTGTIEGTWTGPLLLPPVFSLGGFYSGGVAQSQITMNGTVQYIVEWELTKMTVPVAADAAPALQSGGAASEAATAARPTGPVAPAFTTWVAEQRQAQGAACRAR